MTEPRPAADDLVSTVADFVEEVALPALSGGDAYRARVAVNALRIVARELTSDTSATDRLRSALPGAPSTDAELAELIREGALAADYTDLRAYLVRSVRRQIAVDSPDYPSVAEADRRWPWGRE